MSPSADGRRELAAFLQARRRSSQPLATGRRRTPGLRREEVAAMANISVDYYTRLEQSRAASFPTPAVLDGLAGALGLTGAERAHLYRLAGRSAPESTADHPSPALVFLLHALEPTPAQIVDDLGFVLDQNAAADVLCPWVVDRGLGVANVYDVWFLDERVRQVFPATERQAYSRAQAGELRAAATRRALVGDDSGQRLVERLRTDSPEFKQAWAASEVHDGRTKVVWLPGSAGPLPYTVHTTVDQASGQRLVAFDRSGLNGTAEVSPR